MREIHPDEVYHLAAQSSVRRSLEDPASTFRVNVLGTKSVLDAMRTAGVHRILFSSTAATYGFHAEMPLRERVDKIAQEIYGAHEVTWSPEAIHKVKKFESDPKFRDYTTMMVKTHLSLSHEKEYGIAFVILEGQDIR